MARAYRQRTDATDRVKALILIARGSASGRAVRKGYAGRRATGEHEQLIA